MNCIGIGIDIVVDCLLIACLPLLACLLAMIGGLVA
jgi:hypothetical protein